MELRKLIRETLNESSTRTDVDAVTSTVLDRLADDERAEALHVALREYVRMVIGETRRIGAPAAESTATPPRPGRSWKVTAVREHWKRALEEWYATGTAGGRARLADLSKDELLYNVATREAMARANAAEAATLRRLAEALDETGAARVGDIPAEVLRSVLDTEDAA